jgi:purine-cytosine permease-like protein
VDASATAAPQSAESDALRELYRGAPAPTVPAADAPPPPGYELPVPPSVDSGSGPSDSRPRRRALDDDDLVRSASDDSPPSDTLNAIEQLQAQLHLREQEAQEFATWESAMQAIGTPEALAEVERARAELAATPSSVPSAPTPVDEPVSSAAPPVEESVFDLAPPEDDPIPSLAPPVDEPAASLAPPVDEPAAGLAPPADEPLADLAPPDQDAFVQFAGPEFSYSEPPLDAPPPPMGDQPFAGFAPPTDDAAPDTFVAPADPRDLSFVPPPAIPDAPAFLEPPALVEPPPAPQTPSPPDASAAPDARTEAAPSGFDDLLAGSGSPNPPAESSAFVPPDPAAPPDTATDESAGHRPFGEGVDRDDAVDPSDSIYGSAPGPVSVNTAGVAVVPEKVSLESKPIRVLAPPEVVAATEPVLRRPEISPAERVGLEPTPLEQRVGRSARLFWMWFAANSSIVAIVFGAVIFALGVSLRQAIVGTLAGVALSFLPLGLGTLAGKRSGQPTMVISRATFGVLGNILPAALALLSRLFWAAALLWILGAGTADILIGAQLNDGFDSSELTIVAMSIFFVIATVVAFFGYALIAVVQLVVGVISAVLIVGFVALTMKYVDIGTALTQADGPWILSVTAAVLVFSFVGLAWANTGADVARYQRVGSSGAASVLWASFGAALPTFILVGYGALLAASNLSLAENIAANPLDSLGRLLPVWYPVPLLAATVLSLLSGVVLAMYSGGFALQAAGLRLRRSLSTLLIAALVIVIALFISVSASSFDQLIRDFSTTIAVPVAGWIGIFGAEVMIRKSPLDSKSLLERGGRYPDVRWGNVIALIGITAIGYAFLSATAPGLTWEGYGFTALGIPPSSPVAASDFGVLVALALGLLLSLAMGTSAIRKQEKAAEAPE